MGEKLTQAIGVISRPAIDSLLDSNPDFKYKWLTTLCLVGLYVGGIIVFGFFFNWGRFDMQYQDWAVITGPRLEMLRTALQEGQLPYHISDPEALHGVTDRYLTVADMSLSPQYVLLTWLPLPLFSLVNVWILYSVGFAGLLLIRRKLALSVVSFTIVFLLFNFNGGILAHLSLGHIAFTGYFLFPWFGWLVFRLLDGDRSWLWSTLTSLVLFSIWLQGSYHYFIYMLIVLTGIAIFVPRTFKTVVKTAAITFLVCAFRLLPCILSYTVYKQSFLNGYPSLLSIWNNLVILPNPTSTADFFNVGLGKVLGEWELTNFIGLLGGLFLIYFGFFRGLIQRGARYPQLLGPVAILLFLSFGRVIKVLRVIPFPLIQGERAATRIFCVILLFGVILGAERLQRWLDASPLDQRITLWIGLVLGTSFTILELTQDAFLWVVTNRPASLIKNFDPGLWYPVNNYNDTIYLWLVWGGLTISVVTILVLCGLSWREHRLSPR